MTIDSRIGSIGGFVTCAKSCLKYVNSGGRWSERTASAVSLPIEPIGSSPLPAIGAMQDPQVLLRVAERELALAQRQLARASSRAPARGR